MLKQKPSKKMAIKPKKAALQKSKKPVPPIQEAQTQPSHEPLQSPRGMRDILPSDAAAWEAVTEKARELSSAFGYVYIETPILEQRALFARAVGEGSDIAQKEMYCFKDQGGEELCLRPENTAAISRAYINHGMLNLPQPVKLWSLGPFFRRERPQAGRFRQFHQWGLEVLGDEHAVLDAEVISIALAFFSDLKLPVRLEINSLGCLQCRAVYKEELFKFYSPKQELLCETCKVRLQGNRLRVLDCKEPQCELLKEGAPEITDFLCEACRNHFMRVLEYLDDLAISYNLNPRLVRGLDYYNRTVFEIFPEIKEGREGQEGKDGEEGKEEGQEGQEKERGSQSALCGGGRYDGLVEQLGGRPTPAVGFSVGLERVLAFARNRGESAARKEGPAIFIAQLGEAARRRALSLWHALAREVPTYVALSKDGLKAQLEIANRLAVRYAVILGQKEILDHTAIIRDMEAGIQEVIDYSKVEAEIKKKVGESSAPPAPLT